MFLGEIIKEYRETHGKMSMQEFADKCGLSKGYISLLERNKDHRSNEPMTPSIVTIKKVAEAMEMTFSELYSMLDDDSEITLNDPLSELLSKDEIALLTNYRKLSSKEKETIRIYVKTLLQMAQNERSEE